MSLWQFYHRTRKILQKKVIAATEIWLTYTESTKQYKTRRTNLKKKQQHRYLSPIFINGKQYWWKKGGLGFYIHKSLTYKQINSPSVIECAIVEVCSNFILYRNICLLYKPHVNKMSPILAQIENLLQFTRKLKYDTVLFGYFRIESLTHSIGRTNYKKNSFGIKLQKTKQWTHTSNSYFFYMHWSSNSKLSSWTHNNQNYENLSFFNFREKFWNKNSTRIKRTKNNQS